MANLDPIAKRFVIATQHYLVTFSREFVHVAPPILNIAAVNMGGLDWIVSRRHCAKESVLKILIAQMKLKMLETLASARKDFTDMRTLPGNAFNLILEYQKVDHGFLKMISNVIPLLVTLNKVK